MQIVLKLGMLTIEEIETELMNNFQFLKLRNLANVCQADF